MGFTLQSGRIEDLDTPEAHLAFIRSQWRDFAAFAWGKYTKEGRGGIVVDLRKAAKSSRDLQVPAFYVANGSARLEKLGGWPDEEIATAIKNYDPEQDVIFIFLRLNGDVYNYNVSDELTPPMAFGQKSSLESGS
jgi:hypothetical protein